MSQTDDGPEYSGDRMNENESNDLRRLAENATSGEWTAHSHEDPPWLVSRSDGGELDCIAQTVHGNDEANARYIAAVNPVTIIRLLDTLAKLKKGAT